MHSEEIENNSMFPDGHIDPAKKDKKFVLKYGKALYNSFRKSGLNLFYNNRVEYLENIGYAMGNQSSDQYKQRLDCWEDQDKSWLNLDWQILNLATKFVNVVVGKLNKNDHTVICKAIDALAMDQKKEYKAKLDAFLELKAWMNSVGVDASKFFSEMPDINLDPEELEINLNMNLKHRWCMEMEKLIEVVLDNNKYKQLKRELNWDAAVLGVRVLKITEMRDGLPVLEKTNPENFITSYTEFEDFRNMQNGGEVRLMSPSEFFKRAGKDLTDDQKKDILENFTKTKPVYSHNDGSSNGRIIDEGDGKFIEVFDYCFLSPDTMVYEKKKDKRGNSQMYRKGHGFPGNPEEYEEKYKGEREAHRATYNALYKGLWVIGSEYIVDCGRVENAQVDEFYDNVVPYVVFAPNMKHGHSASMVKQMIPVLNMIQLNWLRFNDAIAKYIPKGAFIDLDALDDINIGKGGKNLTKKEIIDTYFKRGIVVGRRKNMANKGANGMPVEELENGMSKDTERFFNNILMGIGMLRDIIGVNEVTDASTPDPKMLKSLAEAAMAGSNNALDYLFHADNISFETMCQKLSYSIIGAIKRGVKTGIEESVGKGAIKFFGENSEMTKHKYAIKIENKPTQEEWNAFYNQVDIALANKEISSSDAAFVREIDNLKQARQYLIVKEKKKLRMDAEQQQASIEATAKAQQQSAQVTSQLKKDELKAEIDVKLQLEAMKAKNAKELEAEKRKTLQLQFDLDLRNKKELANVEGDVKAGHIAQQGGNDLIKESIKAEKSTESKKNV